ncbi:MAG: glycosyltransferase family 2 protein [Culturomica sp.]|jgi:GT2 family glycosyltransferase|nr:glycosyltransferase family 2 protein [Culturomica sp.]
MKKIVVAILNWNGRELLRTYLPSVVKYSNPDIARIVVIDNASGDGSREMLTNEFPDVEIVALDKNLGYAAGYTVGLQAMPDKGEEYYLMLNSDVEVTEGWLEPLLSLMEEDKRIAVVQPKVKALTAKSVFEYAGACGGFIDKWGFPFCRGRILDTVETDTGQYDDVCDIFWASGAAFLVRKELFRSYGGFDCSFFAHMEEIDLCWRFRRGGYTLKVQPKSTVYHLGGASLPKDNPRKVYLNYLNNLLMIYKNLPSGERRKVLHVRMFFDAAAFLVFMLKGRFASANQIVRAYNAYRLRKKEYVETAPEHSAVDNSIYPKSIVFAYFFKRLRKFSDLRWK